MATAHPQHASEVVNPELRYHGLALDLGGQLKWPEDDPGHPRNWSSWIKIYNTVVVISFNFTMTLFSCSGAGASAGAKDDFHVGSTWSIFCFTSIYLFAQAIGGLICPPISESFGRRPIYICSMLAYCVFCVMVGFAPNIKLVTVGRAFSGFVSSVGCVVVAGSIEDMFDSATRVWIMFLWGSSANIAIALGPVYAIHVTEALGWRWVFWIAAIVTMTQTYFCCLLRESRPSRILQKRLEALNQATVSPTPFTIDNPDEVLTLHTFITESLTRPTLLFFRELIVFCVAVLAAFASAQIYLFSEALPDIYTQTPFNWSESKASLAFVPIIIGLASNVIPRFYDHHHLKKLTAQRRIIHPEDKIRMFAVATPILAIGLWWFAWTIPPKVIVPWYLSFIPLLFVGYATSEFDCTLSGYVADSYTIYCSSAFASLSFCRSILSGVFPLVTKQMYRKLGPNQATSVLAIASTLFCIVPYLFLRHGQGLREKSAFAKFSREAERKMGSTNCLNVAFFEYEAETGVESNDGNILDTLEAGKWQSIDLGEIISAPVIGNFIDVETWLWRNSYLK